VKCTSLLSINREATLKKKKYSGERSGNQENKQKTEKKKEKGKKKEVKRKERGWRRKSCI
jgi:hypothetical protein